MAIVSRLSRLFVSDVHAVLERLEEPELVLKQSIREMEEALQAQQLRLQRGCASLRRMHRRAEELERRLAELDSQLDVSIAAGRVDTSRAIVRRKLECKAQAELIQRRSSELEEQVDALREGVTRRTAELDALREKAQLVCEREECPAGDAGSPEPASVMNDQDVEAALLREIEQRREA